MWEEEESKSRAGVMNFSSDIRRGRRENFLHWHVAAFAERTRAHIDTVKDSFIVFFKVFSKESWAVCGCEFVQ